MSAKKIFLLAPAVIGIVVIVWGVRVAHAMNDPVLGRWLTRDPIAYYHFSLHPLLPVKRRYPISRINTIDGLSLYQFVRSQPGVLVDPSGGCSQEKPTGCKANPPGKHHPDCCSLAKDICQHKGGGTCDQDFKDCLCCKFPNACHTGQWVDPYCQMIAGAGGTTVSGIDCNRQIDCMPFCSGGGSAPDCMEMWVFTWCEKYEGVKPGAWKTFNFCTDDSCMNSCLDYCSNPACVSAKDETECVNQCGPACGIPR